VVGFFGGLVIWVHGEGISALPWAFGGAALGAALGVFGAALVLA
jgi:hypothetical protein